MCCLLQAAQQEQEEEAAAAALDDPEARAAAAEAQRRREAEEWRLQQLRSGAADANANFAPMPGDWRQRVQQQPQQQQWRPHNEAAGAAAAVATAVLPPEAQADASAGAVGEFEMPDLDALSAGLPPGWQAMWDKGHKRVYYGHLASAVSSFSFPCLPGPKPWLPHHRPSTPLEHAAGLCGCWGGRTCHREVPPAVAATATSPPVRCSCA